LFRQLSRHFLLLSRYGPRSHAHSARGLCSSFTHSRRYYEHSSHRFHHVLNTTLFSQYSCCVFARAPSHHLCSRHTCAFRKPPQRRLGVRWCVVAEDGSEPAIRVSKCCARLAKPRTLLWHGGFHPCAWVHTAREEPGDVITLFNCCDSAMSVDVLAHVVAPQTLTPRARSNNMRRSQPCSRQQSSSV
jgi:hypothetical protein